MKTEYAPSFVMLQPLVLSVIFLRRAAFYEGRCHGHLLARVRACRRCASLSVCVCVCVFVCLCMGVAVCLVRVRLRVAVHVAVHA